VPARPNEVEEGLSVDPLADKYPGMSPYNYCSNNPLRLFDPNGSYGWDIHYVWTRQNFGEGIADYDQGVDDNTPAGMIPFVYRNDLHFMSREEAGKLLDEAIMAGDKAAFGRALHSFQDTFSHYQWEGYLYIPVFIGHGVRTVLAVLGLCDDPDADTPGNANDEAMKQQCLEYKVNFNKQNLGQCKEIVGDTNYDPDENSSEQSGQNNKNDNSSENKSAPQNKNMDRGGGLLTPKVYIDGVEVHHFLNDIKIKIAHNVYSIMYFINYSVVCNNIN
jgi:hypothetical protein